MKSFFDERFGKLLAFLSCCGDGGVDGACYCYHVDAAVRNENRGKKCEIYYRHKHSSFVQQLYDMRRRIAIVKVANNNNSSTLSLSDHPRSSV